MPSSPDAVRPMQLDELAARRHARVAAVQPPMFEVSGSARSADAAATAAQAAGYAAGWSQGMRAAAAKAEAEAAALRAATEHMMRTAEAQCASAFTALDRAAAQLERASAPHAEQVTDQILSAAYAIAEALIGRDLRTESDRGTAVLAHVLGLVPDLEDVTVRLSPADHATLSGDGDLPDTARTVRLVADPSLQPGDAIAVSGATTIDARISAGLARVRAALSVGDDGSTTRGSGTITNGSRA